jgi:hypothetical protein
LLDKTLLGRDAEEGDGNLERRVQEYELLSKSDFCDDVARSAFRLVRPSELGVTSDAVAA